jgi:hypothetical protein
MDELSLPTLARATVDQFRRTHELSPSAAADLVSDLTLALLTVVRHERRQCAALCEARGRLWDGTAAREQTPPGLRHEAELRAREAVYLADAITDRGEPAPPG